MDKKVREELYDLLYKDTDRKIEEISDEEMQAAYNSIAAAYMKLNMSVKKLFNDVRKAMQPILDIVEKYGKDL